MPASALTHLYLSPHIDDAVWSCGGQMHRQARSGARVVVVTVCAGNPGAGPVSAYAQAMHDRWLAERGPSGASPEAVVAHRRNEDLAALAHLGAEAVHFDVPDAIYRLNPATDYALYASDLALFGPLHPSEISLTRRLAAKLSTLTRGFGRHHLYVPLGIGNHVDHQLARRAAEVAGGIFAYYEDFPYLAREEARWPNPNSPLLAGKQVLPELAPLTEADLAARIAAMQRYASQVTSFWPGPEAMAEAVQAQVLRTGDGHPAERTWRLGA